MSGARSAAPGVEHEASRIRILRAAAEVAAEAGYEGASISKITKRSGLPASSVYWFFKDKEQLMAEVIRHSFAEWNETQPRWEHAEWDSRPIGEVARSILARSIRSLADGPAFLRIGHMLLLQGRDVEPEARQWFLAVRAETEREITSWVEAYLGPEVVAGDPGLARSLARIVLAATDGAFLAGQAGMPYEPDHFAELIASTVESAIARHG
jgi:AcrR family transcriptional regulator